MPRYDSEWVQVMLRPELRGSPNADDIVAAIGIQPGDTVADIGCGPGFLTIPAAVAVGPTGQVDAIDIEPSMLEVVRGRASSLQLSNVRTRLATEVTLPLPDAGVDVVICALVLHDLEDPEIMMREIARVVRPTGKVAIVEWTPDVENPRKNRIRPDVTARLLAQIRRQAGDPIPLPPTQYLIVGTPD
jgi:ubiquinone/menaquinone biosynthesis C-methylase UbiE